jgi:polyisoprenoid-binding protein YceI
MPLKTFAAAAAMGFAALSLASCQKQTNTEPPPAGGAGVANATPPKGEPFIADPAKTDAPAGTYTLDPHHSTVVFRLSHLGFSEYTGGFAKLGGTLRFDPAHPEAMSVNATIDPRSLTIPDPPAGFHDALTGKAWLDAAKYPEITFRSTKVTKTGANTADVTGDFTLHGVTRPVTLAIRFNGGYPANAFDGARVGFSGHTTIRRSDFGIADGLPAPGTNMGVGDLIDVRLETEWNSGKPTQPSPAG